MNLSVGLLTLLCLMVNVDSIRFPSRKTWWAKQITDELHVTGRLTENQIKYAKESGYKSIISLFNITRRDHIGPGEVDPLPTTDEAEALSSNIGLKFATLLTSDQNDYDWATESTLMNFSQTFESLPTPLILYDNTGYASAFIGLLHYLKISTYNSTAVPRIDVRSFFKIASVLGYSYTKVGALTDLVMKIANVSKLPEDLPTPELVKPEWYTAPDGWQVKPMFGNIYFCGQVQSNHLPIFKKTGFNVFINVRKGVETAGKPSQEESILLNIKDATGTYNQSGFPVRQIKENLEKNRIDANLSNSYISPTSQVNYQSINTIQFGDDVGYNETIEREAFGKEGIDYHHMPIGGVYKYTLRMWKAYRDNAMRLARKEGSILLMQCRTSYRSVVLAMLVHGCLNGRNSSEMLERAYIHGFQFEADKEADVVQLMKDVLDNREEECGETSGAATRVKGMFLITLSLSAFFVHYLWRL